MRIQNFFKLVIAIAVSEAAGIIGAFFTTPAIQSGPSAGSGLSWYATLAKPELAPPNWVFGPVWTTLYALIGISLYLVWKNKWEVRYRILHSHEKAWNRWSQRLWTGDLQKLNAIAVFAAHFALNILWSAVFFGMQSPGFAFAVIIALWVSIVYVIVNFYRISKPAAWLLVPYILWVTFAAYLNFSIWVMN